MLLEAEFDFWKGIAQKMQSITDRLSTYSEKYLEGSSIQHLLIIEWSLTYPL